MKFHENDNEAKKRKMATARARFEKTTEQMAKEHRFGGAEAQKNEIDTTEEATALVKKAKK